MSCTQLDKHGDRIKISLEYGYTKGKLNLKDQEEPNTQL